MSPTFIAIIFLVLLIVGILYIRIPIAFLLAILGIGGYAILDSTSLALNMAGNEIWSVFSNYGLTVIPFFIFMGQICFYSNLSKRLYASIQTWCGHKRGGLSLATIMACGGFAAICGSNTATAATMSVVALPEMNRYGYSPLLSTGTVVAGTTLGAIIPPSVVAIVVGVQTAQSIEALFLGSLFPGLLLLACFMITVPIILRLRPNFAPVAPKSSMKERINSLSGFVEGAILFGLVVVCLGLGFFTPTEAGVAGASAAILMGIITRTLSLKGFLKALDESFRLSAMLLFLLAGASMFGKFLTLTRLPFELATNLANSPLAEPLILLIVLVIFIVGGMVMDALALLVIALPIFFPLAEAMNWNTLWFSVVLIAVTSLGAMTPPVGIAAYIVSNVSEKNCGKFVPLNQVFKGAMMFLPAYFVCLVLLIAFPTIVLMLPELLKN